MEESGPVMKGCATKGLHVGCHDDQNNVCQTSGRNISYLAEILHQSYTKYINVN